MFPLPEVGSRAGRGPVVTSCCYLLLLPKVYENLPQYWDARQATEFLELAEICVRMYRLVRFWQARSVQHCKGWIARRRLRLGNSRPEEPVL